MQIKNKMATSQTSGNMSTENIGISDNAQDQMMILNILTKSVYTDPLAAVLREYGCNGADANVEAGKGDLPIDVRLPNKLDPTLSIRDYGFGMDQEQMIKTFCRLGKSSKRDSNAFTGMLGIGSKAGFAYGDQFMVISRSKGVKTIYNAFRDKGIPKLAKMHEEPTDEPSGIEIKVPVRAEDMPEFTAKAERVYRYFKVRPNITGAVVTWGDRSQEFAGTGWRFLGRGQQSVAIMGNVGYKLDGEALGAGGPPVEFTWQRRHSERPEGALLDLGIELDFNIGDLEVAANREGLQYDEETKKVLLAKLQVVISEIGQVLSDKIANAPSMWEAKMQFHSLFDGLSTANTYDLHRVIGPKIVWQGTPINSARVTLHSDIDGASVSRFSRNGGRTHATGALKIRLWPNPHELDASENVTLVINDLKSKANAPARMRGHFSTHPQCTDIVVFAFHSQKAQDDYWKEKHLEGAPTINLSTIAPQVLAFGGTSSPSAHKSKHSAKAFKLIETSAGPDYRGHAKSSCWEIESVDLKDDAGVYVELSSFNVREPKTKMWSAPWGFVDTVKLLRAAGMITGPVYGFKADRIPKLGPKWVPLADSLQKRMDTLVAKDGFAQEIADYIAVTAYDALLPDSSVKLFPDGSSVRALLDEQVRMRKPRQKKLMEVVESRDAEAWLERPVIPAPSVDLETLELTARKDYPMIDLAIQTASYRGKLCSMGGATMKKIAAYVRLVDNRGNAAA